MAPLPPPLSALALILPSNSVKPAFIDQRYVALRDAFTKEQTEKKKALSDCESIKSEKAEVASKLSAADSNVAALNGALKALQAKFDEQGRANKDQEER